jgi:hypothetical protein
LQIAAFSPLNRERKSSVPGEILRAEQKLLGHEVVEYRTEILIRPKDCLMVRWARTPAWPASVNLLVVRAGRDVPDELTRQRASDVNRGVRNGTEELEVGLQDQGRQRVGLQRAAFRHEGSL